MFLDTKQKKECFGCMACLNVCPTNAITMKEDEEGFLYPVIDSKRCIRCNMCRKVCPYKKQIKQIDMDIYGVKLKDVEERRKSQSGGAFTAIATYILNNNGIVYGVATCEELAVKHIRISKLEELKRIKGSKYVQSDMQEIYRKVEDDLRNDELVLFSGTACQIKGIQEYIEMKKIPNEKLYTCDLICHGVPSPKIYREYIEFFENKYHTKIKAFDFRDKKYGWKEHIETMQFQNNRKVTKPYYRNIFYSNNALRPSCYSCQFATSKRVSDFTVGDFWGIEKSNEQFSDRDGVSLILVQTERGKELFKNILEKDYLIYFSTKLENCLQHNLQQPTEIPITRGEFWKGYDEFGFKYILKKYGNYSVKEQMKTSIYYFLRRIKKKLKDIKKILKK